MTARPRTNTCRAVPTVGRQSAEQAAVAYLCHAMAMLGQAGGWEIGQSMTLLNYDNDGIGLGKAAGPMDASAKTLMRRGAMAGCWAGAGLGRHRGGTPAHAFRPTFGGPEKGHGRSRGSPPAALPHSLRMGGRKPWGAAQFRRVQHHSTAPAALDQRERVPARQVARGLLRGACESSRPSPPVLASQLAVVARHDFITRPHEATLFRLRAKAHGCVCP